MKIKPELDPNLEVRTIEEHNAYLAELEKNKPTPILSIMIATTKDRRFMFNLLCQEFYRQIHEAGLSGKGIEEWYVIATETKEDDTIEERHLKARYEHKQLVELLHHEDNREISIGAKRQGLLERATGEYIVYFDSDDFPKPDYIKKIVKALEEKPDCVGFKIEMTTNGKNPQTCCHSLKYKQWKNNVDGFDYVRSVTIFNPVKRELALKVGFESIRYGEDKKYSDGLTPLCNTEVYINDFLFDYRYSTEMPHAEKYGIK